MSMTPFERATLDTHVGKTRIFTDATEVYLNNRYQVAKEILPSPAEGMPEMMYLTIKRRDKKPIREWRDLLWIKNQLAGEECEAVELFPAMSRLMDTSNQYHLYVLPPTWRYAFGVDDQVIIDGDGKTVPGKSRQQPLPAWYPKPTHTTEEAEEILQKGTT